LLPDPPLLLNPVISSERVPTVNAVLL
jgi:hypothetical protein